MAASRVLGQSDYTSGGKCKDIGSSDGMPPSGGAESVTSTSLSVPAGMAFDRNGDLWVTDSFNHRTLKYSAHPKR
ncbi:hypothetical protein ACFS5L_45365 [Streptomyces phyllanthi]|uniref:SMP-30/Gluconolactonase/LRE-like region domain-containing protein n=1 Tax=Streptomyces phyllanthi TaxID=1803180 RepID=A0A5N8W8W9_9ACTN|nr:hypothetical protein [Streptomyces phyllanthi]MPY43927.1 hypothetical protein [Streptomyces phyllanthi]